MTRRIIYRACNPKINLGAVKNTKIAIAKVKKLNQKSKKKDWVWA